MKDALNSTIIKTERGFNKIEFFDSYGCPCSLQESSNMIPHIWLGVENTRMHLSKKQVKSLRKILKTWLQTGDFTKPKELPMPDHRLIHVIASDIRKEWGDKVYFGAKPYLEAMRQLSTLQDHYGQDDAKSIIVYFLGNASTFRGERARELKAELKKIAGIK